MEDVTQGDTQPIHERWEVHCAGCGKSALEAGLTRVTGGEHEIMALDFTCSGCGHVGSLSFLLPLGEWSSDALVLNAVNAAQVIHQDDVDTVGGESDGA